MPISSGANSWPASYWHKPSPKQQNTKLVVIDRENSRPPSPVRKPSTPPPPAQPRPPPPDTEMYIEHHSPPPQQKIYFQNPPHQQQVTTTFMQQRPPPPPQVIYQQPPHPSHMRVTSQGYPGHPGYQQYPPYGYGSGGGGGCGDASCCADQYFSTNTAGANAGCCQGGMFGSRSYPYNQEHMYMMKGTGRRRCCACVWGLILGLLLLGLLIGLLAGLLPALKKKAAVASILNKFQGGYLVDGVYYYKVTNPPDIFYFIMGPGIPCNPHNNNSALTPPPPKIYIQSVNETNGTVNVTVSVTEPPQVTLPNCNSITTSYVLANGISVSTTTINPFLALTSSVEALLPKAFATFLAVAIVRVLLEFGAATG